MLRAPDHQPAVVRPPFAHRAPAEMSSGCVPPWRRGGAAIRPAAALWAGALSGPQGRGGEPRQGSAAWVARCVCRIADCVPAAECLRCPGHTRCRAQVRGLWAVACCSCGASCRLARDFSLAQEWRTWVGCWRCSSSRRAVATQVGRAGRPLSRARKLQWALGRRVPGPCRRAAVAYPLLHSQRADDRRVHGYGRGRKLRHHIHELHGLSHGVAF
jgi:hypothetical protein